VTLDWPDPGGKPAVGVIGWPVEQSVSPPIHNAAFADLGMDWIYVRLPVPPGAMSEAMQRLAADEFRGANVTMPHKTAAAELAAELSEDAATTKAVNTLVASAGGFAGHNTDTPGFANFLRQDTGFDAHGRSALIFGGGGAGRACALALAREGIETVFVAVRDRSKGAAVAEVLAGIGVTLRILDINDAASAGADLVVNATPLGTRREHLPAPRLGPGIVAVDLVYHPRVTPFLEAARAAGAAAFGGLGMLVHQAALSFELWTGIVPSLDVMRAAAESAPES